MPEAIAGRKKVNSGTVADLVREYNLYQGFDVVSVGGLGLGLVRMIAESAAETSEERTLMGILDGLKKVIVVEYEEADGGRKDAFNREISVLLDDAEKMVEVKDDGETVNIYGSSSSDGEHIDDLIIFIPEECTLVCLFGRVSAEKVADILKMADE